MKRYRVLNAAGGCEQTTDERDAAILAALTLPMVGSVYDGDAGETLDLSGHELGYTDDGEPYLEDVTQ